MAIIGYLPEMRYYNMTNDLRENRPAEARQSRVSQGTELADLMN